MYINLCFPGVLGDEVEVLEPAHFRFVLDDKHKQATVFHH